MTMTRRDYAVIAGAVKDLREIHPDGVVALTDVEGMLAIVLKNDNPRFDIDVFMRACSVTS